MILPLFLYKVFIDSVSTTLEELGLLVVLAEKTFLVENMNAPNHNEMKDKIGDLLFFL